MSTPRYAHNDTTRPDGCYVQLSRVILPDDTTDAPDQRDDGFWPSRDPNSAGYVGAENIGKHTDMMRAATERYRAWERGDWSFVGVRARANVLIVRNGVGTCFNIDSAGLWGIESDAGDYLNEAYGEEVSDLKDMIAALASPIYEED